MFKKKPFVIYGNISTLKDEFKKQDDQHAVIEDFEAVENSGDCGELSVKGMLMT